MNKIYFLILSIFGSNIAFAGGIGGGNPPSVTEPQELMVSVFSTLAENEGFIIEREGVQTLIAKASLDTVVVIQKENLSASGIVVPEKDFSALSDAANISGSSIVIENEDGERKSFKVQGAVIPGQLILTDESSPVQ